VDGLCSDPLGEVKRSPRTFKSNGDQLLRGGKGEDRREKKRKEAEGEGKEGKEMDKSEGKGERGKDHSGTSFFPFRATCVFLLFCAW